MVCVVNLLGDNIGCGNWVALSSISLFGRVVII